MTTFTSSPYTNVFKYAAPTLTLLGSLFAIFMMVKVTEQFPQNFLMAFVVVAVWSFLNVIPMPFYLKKIRVDERGVSFRHQGLEKVIPFSQIRSVSLFEPLSANVITIRYTERGSEDVQRVMYLPNPEHQRPLKLDEMTLHLQERAARENPQYQVRGTLRNVAITFLFALPALALTAYFVYTGLPG